MCLLTLFFIFVTLNEIFNDNAVSSVETTKFEQEFATTMERRNDLHANAIFRKIVNIIDEFDKINIERFKEGLKENIGGTTLKDAWQKVLILKENYGIKEMTQGGTTYWTQ